MDRLSLILTMLTGAVLSGVITTTAFTFGWYGWVPILGAVAVGYGLAWPTAFVISRRIKRTDPAWPEEREGPLPKRGAREV